MLDISMWFPPPQTSPDAPKTLPMTLATSLNLEGSAAKTSASFQRFILLRCVQIRGWDN